MSPAATSAFRTALDRQQQLCPAGCTCARAAAASTAHVEVRPNATSQCASAPRGLRAYLGGVYPVASRRLVETHDKDVAAFFDSLHFYYDFGCPRANAGLDACFEPGVMLRWLYAGLLPCREVTVRGKPSLAACIHAHSRFDPEWAREAVAAGFVEVEHRAIGFAVRASGPQMARLLHDGQPCNASVFMDAGVAAMWYTVRRGSGIFYRLGRVKLAAGKTGLVAELLHELGGQPSLAAHWPAVAMRANLFAAAAPSGGALVDAERIRAVANGSASCVDQRLQPCRCRYVLHDAWDDAMIWVARALGYETLFISATLLCNQPMSGGVLGSGSASSRGFATAYPEIVDVRPLGAETVREQAEGVHSYLQEDPAGAAKAAGHTSTAARPVDHATTSSDEASTGLDVHTRRKRPEVADVWVHQMRDARLLSLRDPFDVANEARARPCVFSVHRFTLQCANHLSSRWPMSAWARCGIVGCGYTISGGASARRAARGNASVGEGVVGG